MGCLGVLDLDVQVRLRSACAAVWPCGRLVIKNALETDLDLGGVAAQRNPVAVLCYFTAQHRLVEAGNLFVVARVKGDASNRANRHVSCPSLPPVLAAPAVSACQGGWHRQRAAHNMSTVPRLGQQVVSTTHGHRPLRDIRFPSCVTGRLEGAGGAPRPRQLRYSSPVVGRGLVCIGRPDT